jgi:hypothetical protein
MSESFTFEGKYKLAERIRKLVNKKDLQQIKNIIEGNNPDLSFMKNSNGYFMQFQNLSDDTYAALTKFLDKLDKKKQKEIESEILENSEALTEEITGLTDDTSEKTVSKKLRLTNTESHILNRVKYEKELKKNETNSDDQVTYFNPNDSKQKTQKLKTEEIFVQTKKTKQLN